MNSEPITEDWGFELDSLEKFIEVFGLPETIELPNAIITDPKKFINSHIQECRYNNGKSAFKPYLNRLRQLREELERIYES